MLAYAAGRPRIAASRPSPNALLAIIAAHVALVAVVMSARMEMPPRLIPKPIEVKLIPEPLTPPENVTEPVAKPQQKPTVTPSPPHEALTTEARIINFTPIFSNGVNAIPVVNPVISEPPIPTPVPVRSGPRLLTPASELRPPYPASKLLTEEEAVLILRLSIDERGRVVAVDPVGSADPVFLGAARRYLVAHWRYKPASRDGSPVASSTIITLKFQLDG
jgi:protein TonB